MRRLNAFGLTKGLAIVFGSWLTLLASASLTAAETTGKWDVTSVSSLLGTVKRVIEIKSDTEGTYGTEAMRSPLKELKIEEDRVRFLVTLDIPEAGGELNLRFDGRVDGHMLYGEFQIAASGNRAAVLTGIRQGTPKITVSDDLLQSYAGEYTGGPTGNLAITAKENGLVASEVEGVLRIDLFPASETQFYCIDHNVQLTFKRNENGEVTGITFVQGEDPEVALRRVSAASGLQTDEAGSAFDQLDPFVSKAFAMDLAPGMAIAVVKDGEVVYAKGFGYADVEAGRAVTPETLFYIASTTKSFTAFAVAILDHRGEINLDGALSEYLPQLRLQSPLSPDKITLRDLLTHTHGIANIGPVTFRTAYSGQHTPQQLVELLGAHGAAPTGRNFSYGNIGYNVAGMAMDAELGIGWKEVLTREVFAPLGMNDTRARMGGIDPARMAMPYTIRENGFSRLPYVKGDANMHAAGGHITTALDLAKWIRAHLDSGRLGGRQIFPDQVVAETHRKQADQDRNYRNHHVHGWGLGWDLGTYEGETLITRFGGFPGFRSHVSFMPERGIGVVVLVNEAQTGSALNGAVADYCYDRLLEKPDIEDKHAGYLARIQMQVSEGRRRIGRSFRADTAKRAARPQRLPHPLAAYAGSYENARRGRMEWRIADGKLEVRMGLLHSATEVYNAQQNQLRVELYPGRGGEVISFSIEGDRAKSLRYSGREYERVDR